MYASYDERTYCMPVMCGKKHNLMVNFFFFFQLQGFIFALLVYYLSEVFKACLELISAKSTI